MSETEINGIESLHNHTTASDGLLNHFQFLEQARDHGYSVIAFTDHDILPPLSVYEELQQPQWKIEFPTKYIWGIEISSRPPEEDNLPNADIHIIGLFVDPKNERLRQYCAKVVGGRREGMKFVVNGLVKLGFKITEDDCLREAGSDNINRTHMMHALLANQENDAILSKHIEAFEKAAEADPSLKVKYPDILPGSKSWDTLYQLAFKKDAYLPGAYCGLQKADVREATAMIHEAGGIAVLAHYFSIQNKIPLEKCREWMKNGYLDGMETFYGLGERSDNPDQYIPQQEIIKQMCIEEKKVWFVGGGDIHRPVSLQLYAESSLGVRSKGMSSSLLQAFPAGKFNLAITSSL